jgi:uroporphyrinogen-III decarboxylase
LIDLRGYANLILDMVDEEPRLWQLIEMVESFNLALTRNFIHRANSEWLGFAEDLGMQQGPMISPVLFRKYIKPSYRKMMKLARDEGAVVHMHSDGDITQLFDDIQDCGVDVLNLQDLVNGLDWIKANVKGKMCIDLDVDRQGVTFCGTPKQVDDLILREVSTLGDRTGGLMMIYGLYPGVPLENAHALMDAMERYSSYYN